MNWDAIGAIGEIIGAIAVLVTLIYLSVQIRQSSETQRAQTYQQLTHDRIINYRLMIQNKEIRDAISKAQFGKPLTADEQRLLYWLSMANLRAYENELYQHSKGMIEDEELELQRKLLEYPYVQIETVEAISLHTFTPKTQELIRRLAKKRRTAS